eukprot:TRINITY_DN1850_c0_g2_i1.p1 TRINITY_DN1850_c0_g2~~TRINITY_DN1850_c0_g2_i1.p1  ORF type:complete len:411 (+),score=124.41 TRINITY_DN1850_c0_g2_i1:154-1233(+)
MVCSSLAVADRSGLFTLLADARREAASGGPPYLTVPQIAERGRYHPRYVEELVGGLACFGILEHEGGGYRISQAASDLLANPAHPLGMAGWADMVPAVFSAVPGVTQAMKTPEHPTGVPFSSFVEWGFAKGMERVNSPGIRAVYVRKWLAELPDTVRRLKEEPTKVADVGCGSGAVAVSIAAAFPLAKVVGYDLDPTSVQRASNVAASAGLTNCTFVCASIDDLPEGAFDLVTNHDCVHDLPNPLRSLRAIRRSLRPGGVFFSAEPNCGETAADNIAAANRHPQIAGAKAFSYSLSLMHCMTVSLANGEGAKGLGSATFGPRCYEGLAREAGFNGFRKVLNTMINNFYELTVSAPSGHL